MDGGYLISRKDSVFHERTSLPQYDSEVDRTKAKRAKLLVGSHFARALWSLCVQHSVQRQLYLQLNPWDTWSVINALAPVLFL